jgi:hypothetical protein
MKRGNLQDSGGEGEEKSTNNENNTNCKKKWLTLSATG